MPCLNSSHFLQTLHRLHRVGECLIRLGNGVSLDETSNGLAKEFDIIEGVVSLHLLVQVRVECDLLHIFGVAQLNERLTGTIVRVEHLLQDVEDSVGGSIKLIVISKVRPFNLFLGGKPLSAFHELNNGLSSHATGLGGEVDTLTRALGDIPSGISNEGHAALDAAGTIVLRDWVGLNLDDLSPSNLISSTVADGLLVLLNGRAVHNGSSSNTNVIIFGEDPSVEVRGDIVADIHLSHLLVERHLILSDLDALLEGNGEVVLASVHGLRHARVGAVGSDDEVDVHLGGFASRLARLEGLVFDGVLLLRLLVALGHVDGGDEAGDGLSAIRDGAVAQELVHDLAAAHADVLVGLEGVADVHLHVGGGDEFHTAHLAVNSRLGDVKLPDHAEGNGPTAWLGIVHLPLEQHGVDVLLLREDLGGARS
mmetsp:Transcript_7160/g.15532  ORF Transcript_7160/g.15532 Transcript_7160/m.15532 type:complete len:424 (-) Transcript_7160:245-1516(-)